MIRNYEKSPRIIAAGLTHLISLSCLYSVYISQEKLNQAADSERIQNTSLAVSLRIDLGERQRALPSNPDDLVLV